MARLSTNPKNTVHRSPGVMTAALPLLFVMVATGCGGQSALNDARPDRDDGLVEVDAGEPNGAGQSAEEGAAETDDDASGDGSASGDGTSGGGNIVNPSPVPTSGTEPPTRTPPAGTTPSKPGGITPATPTATSVSPTPVPGTPTPTPTTPTQPKPNAPDDPPPQSEPPIVEDPPVVVPPTPPGPAPGTGGSPSDPDPVDPEPVDPEPVDPDPVDPEPVDPDPVAPEPGEPPPDVPPDLDGELPEGCETLYERQAAYGCSLELECDGRYTYADCSSEGDWSYCWCDANGVSVSAELPGDSSGDACTYMAEVCLEADLGDEETCDRYQEAGTQYCQDSMQCVEEVELPGGGYAQSYYSDSVWCQREGTSWRCNCSSPAGSAQFDWDPGTTGSQAVCGLAHDMCEDLASVTPAGPISCVPSYQSASASGYCSSQQDCQQAAALGDEEVYLHGYVWTDCEAWDEENYLCSCGSGSEQVEFAVPATGSVWDTCTAAATTCLDQIEVSIGSNYGGGFGYPVPR